ncbi:unnamed protein product [Cyclocybe aegerita]|uniref:Uncharacterized protein n=1 Tax=Cyclocybe aegerita TaxID=1973307 RepID=A0A8S0W0N4_CYCAE|nr:unnamed protein product [Cyclocybe aegerita]
MFGVIPTNVSTGGEIIEWGGNVTDSAMIMFFILACLTALVNTTLAMLVSLRLYLHQKHTRKILGSEYGSPYSRIITICIEACALIVICECLFIVLFFVPGRSSTIPEQLMVHVSVISPLLIISRTARGKDAISTLRREQTLREGAQERQLRLETLRFSSSEGSLVDQVTNGVEVGRQDVCISVSGAPDREEC